MARIVCKISCVAIFNLLYTSMFSDGITLIPYDDNPIVGRPFKLECNTETTIVATVNIKSPDDTSIGSCVPAVSPFPATCSNAAGYEANLNESLHTLRINTSSMASDVNGTWVCLHDGKRATYVLASPLTEIKDERLHLTPFTNNITTTSVSLTATYECINKPVHFKWIVENESSKKTELVVKNTVEVNSSLCTAYSGFDAYTETYSSSSAANSNEHYRIGVEVYYMGGITALQSIQYFNTYFIFSSGGTNTSTDNGDGKAIGILAGCLVIAYIIVIVMIATCPYCGCIWETCVNCCLECCCQSIAELILTSSATQSSQTGQSFTSSGRESSQEGEDDPGFFKDKVLTLKSLRIFTYLVFYGVIVEVIVLLAVYYGYSKFQEELVIGVGFVIVLVLSGLCLLVVVWMLMKFVNNDASETSRSQSLLKNATVTPRQTGKSQKKSTFDKRQQPDGHEGPQSTSEDPNSRHLATTRPLPPRPNIAAPQKGPFDSVNSLRPISLAPIENPNNPSLIDRLDEQETDKKPKDKKKKKKKKKKDDEQDNPADEQDNNVLTSLKDTIKSKDM